MTKPRNQRPKIPQTPKQSPSDQLDDLMTKTEEDQKQITPPEPPKQDENPPEEIKEEVTIVIPETLSEPPPPPPIDPVALKKATTQEQQDAARRKKAETIDEMKRRSALVSEFNQMSEQPVQITVVKDTLDKFIEIMKPGSARCSPVEGAKQQLAFYRMMMYIFSKDGKDFNDAISYLLGVMQEQRVEVFNDMNALRFVGGMRGTEAERDYARVLLTLLISMIDPRTKDLLLKRTDFNEFQRLASLATNAEKGSRATSLIRSYIKKM